MGRMLLVGRLVLGDLQRRRAETVLLLLAIMAATTTLTLGLVLRGVTDDPYAATRTATAGPDIIAAAAPGGRPADLAGLEALAGKPGVTAHSGPYPAAGTELGAHGRTAPVQVEGRDTGTARWTSRRSPRAAGSPAAAWWSRPPLPMLSTCTPGTRSRWAGAPSASPESP